MTTDPDVAALLAGMPLARLTHFTPARNLPHILRDGELRSVAEMSSDARACFAATDLERFDGQRDKISCSLQYPNGYYFDIARRKTDAVNFPDWACLLIDKAAAAAPGTLFSARNAAAGGAVLLPGTAGLSACYADEVPGTDGAVWRRQPAHDPGSPTDVQAEVLVAAPVPLSLVRAIVFPSEAAASQEHGRLEQFELSDAAPPFAVSAGLFDKRAVATAVRRGIHPPLAWWRPALAGDA